MTALVGSHVHVRQILFIHENQNDPIMLIIN